MIGEERYRTHVLTRISTIMAALGQPGQRRDQPRRLTRRSRRSGGFGADMQSKQRW